MATEALTLEAPSIAVPLSMDSTLQEWLADDEARRFLLAQRDGRAPDDELVRVIGTMPMSTLTAFGELVAPAGALEGFLAGR